MYKILGIAGSLRQKSLNKFLLNASSKLAPDELEINVFDIKDIPLYNGDIETEGLPESVADMKKAIKAADAVLLVTPEYNHSVSGVLKNALDWASRNKSENVFKLKPVAIMGASDGRFATVRAQIDLRKILITLHSYTMPFPWIHVDFADKKFDDQGNLNDDKLTEDLREFLNEFVVWINRFAEPKSKS